MSKPLELTVFKKEPGRYGREATYNSPDGLWAYPASHADGYAQRKRLTEAELAAEYYRACYLYESDLADNDGYDGMPETREHRRHSLILHRFATRPHYDEAMA